MSDLPIAGRFRLFITVLLLFLVVGFTAKSCFGKLNWIGPNEKSLPTSAAETTLKAVEEYQVTSLDLKKSEKTTALFFKSLQSTKTSSRPELRKLTTDLLYATLIREKSYTSSERIWTLKNMTCEPKGSQIRCLTQWLLKEIEGEKVNMIERVYEVELIRKETDWIVQDVIHRASLN